MTDRIYSIIRESRCDTLIEFICIIREGRCVDRIYMYYKRE